MKRAFLTLIFALSLGATFSQKADTLCLFLKDDSPTNIREKPSNGKVVKTISEKHDVGVCVCEVRNGWWRIAYDYVIDYDNDTEITWNSSTGEAWIHYSVLAFDTRNYGKQKLHLRKNPSAKAAITWSFSEEIRLRPLDCKNGWIKATTMDGKHTGWLEMEWFCGNPLTTCC